MSSTSFLGAVEPDWVCVVDSYLEGAVLCVAALVIVATAKATRLEEKRMLKSLIAEVIKIGQLK